MDSELKPVVDFINSIIEEKAISKGVREKLKMVVGFLNEEESCDVAVNKSLSVLEELESDPNIDSYARTQIYSVVSILGEFEQY